VFLMHSNVYAGWLWGPNNFEECVAENIKTTSSETAAKAINMACRGLFPEKKYKTFEHCVNEKQNEKRLQELEEQRDNVLFRTSVFIDPASDCRTYFPTAETKKYYKCLLKDMKGVSTDTAAKVIINNCRKKYFKN
ncbi:MAG: hypothetical protein NT055_04690, partial [Nitrospirae bacterium]|nr:hypothetical protein [Nitrospirota bacterium]